MKNYDRRHVASIGGSIWNDNTRTVANALNTNAEILKEVLDRLDMLEVFAKSLAQEIEATKKEVCK